ncbi:MAG: hypothetical protein AAF403_05505, partial [Pseudomonadota bacterium]
PNIKFGKNAEMLKMQMLKMQWDLLQMQLKQFVAPFLKLRSLSIFKNAFMSKNICGFLLDQGARFGCVISLFNFSNSKASKMLAMMIAVLALPILLSSCAPHSGSIVPNFSNKGSSDISEEAQTSLYKGLPIPADTVVNVERTLILGSGNKWNGVVVMRSKQSVEDVAYFYQQQLSGSGWKELAIVQGSTSTLTFQLRERVIIVRLVRKGRSTDIEITFVPVSKPEDSNFSE